jgi:hypothetical protein
MRCTPRAAVTDTSGTLTFPQGVTSRTITVPLNADGVPEPNETFFVNLSAPTAGPCGGVTHVLVDVFGYFK